MSALRVPFAKTEAHGNDFLLVEDGVVEPEARAALARALCDRLRGIGADGLLFYRAAKGDFAMTLHNSDGSIAEISGNGLRCLAAYLVYRGASTGNEVEVSTGAGRRSLSLLERGETRFRFRANMGAPRELAKETLVASGESFPATTLSLGNPHCVLFSSGRNGLDMAELRRIGPVLECHPRFPQRTNVELVEVVSPAEIRMAIWERGVGETASSGTGSSASAVASIWNGLARSPLRVHCPGGVMTVEWKEGGDVFLSGDAAIVAEGTYFFESVC